MSKKYIVKDEDGKVVEVTEYEKDEVPAEEPAEPAKAEEPAKPGEVKDELFSEEQLAEIKRIVAEAVQAALHQEQPNEEPAPAAEEPAAEPQPSEEPSEEETHDKAACGDSKTVPGAIPSKKVNDSTPVVDSYEKEKELNKAWEKRFR